jgi:hypothetical protein
MAAFIDDARRLVEDHLPRYFWGRGAKRTVGTRPERITEISAIDANRTGRYGAVMTLRAQSVTGKEEDFDLRMPNLRTQLALLAEQGPGFTVVVNGVKWKFIRRESFLSPLPFSVFRLPSFVFPLRTRHYPGNTILTASPASLTRASLDRASSGSSSMSSLG